MCILFRNVVVCLEMTTVMTQFSAQGAYVLLVIQGRALIGKGVFIREWGTYFFDNNNMRA